MHLLVCYLNYKMHGATIKVCVQRYEENLKVSPVAMYVRIIYVLYGLLPYQISLSRLH